MILLGALAIGAGYILFFTPQGQVILHNHAQYAAQTRTWVGDHYAMAVIALLVAYLVCGNSGVLPVWPLQVFSGYAFGLVWGVVWASLAAGVTSCCVTAISEWMAGDWFENRIQSRMARLKRVSLLMDNNSVLVAMAVRLMHVVPFGLSNYAFGLLRMKPLQVGIGTLLGGFPAITFYVTTGSDPTLLKRWQWYAVVIGINLVLISPLAVRYLLTRRRNVEAEVVMPEP